MTIRSALRTINHNPGKTLAVVTVLACVFWKGFAGLGLAAFIVIPIWLIWRVNQSINRGTQAVKNMGKAARGAIKAGMRADDRE